MESAPSSTSFKIAIAEAWNAQPVHNRSTHTDSSGRKHTWIGRAFSNARSAVEGKPSQEPDPELGVRGTVARSAAAQSGYSSFPSFFADDEDFMVSRRFGYLHKLALLYKQDELKRLEDELAHFDPRNDDYVIQVDRQRSRNDKDKLIKAICEKLSAYGE